MVNHMKYPFLFVLVLFIMGVLVACDDEIGDSCSQNADCSSSGNRLCDTSMPGGYCTVEGCSSDSCPDGSACIAFYPVGSLIHSCNPTTEDRLGDAAATDDCLPTEVCLTSGFCAPVSLERRFCMKKCGGDGDCRDAYECRTSGDHGSQKVPRENQNYATVGTSRFCAPKQ